MEYEKISNNEYDIQPEKNRQIFSNFNDNKNNISEIPNEKINIQIYQDLIINKYTIIILIIFFILFFLLLLYFQQNNNNISTILTPSNKALELESNYTQIIPKNADIYKQEKFLSRKRAYKKAFNFLSNNTKGILTKEIPKQPIFNPIASAIIPVYNSKQYITKAIRSIQNQNIMNIEIILINDFSTDDTLSLISEFQKEDQRIKIINNKKNKGILYSRCIGTLSAEGKYIFPLDNDDMFLDEDVFSTITNIAEKGFFDIVEFKGIYSKKGNSNDILKNKIGDTKYSHHPLNLVLYQPQLGNYHIWSGKNSISSYHLESVYLWAKCIRTEIYKKAINKLGEEKYNRFILRYEDIIMNYALFNIARSYKFVGKYGVLYIYRKSSASRKVTRFESDRYHIYYLDTMIDFVQDTISNKIILVNLLMFLLNRSSLKNTFLKDKNIKKLFINCLDKIMKMDKISAEFKNKIRQKGSSLKYLDYKF